jgi:hypothetical protein
MTGTRTRVRPPSSSLRTRAWRTAVGASRTAKQRLGGEGALPAFLVVGAQRAGTTSLHEYLATHPQVRWPRLLKGMHYFTTAYTRGDEWYRAQFPSAQALQRRRQITGEASPYYLFHPYAAERIRQTIPDVRIIAVLRDPVKRAWSHYHHEVARGNEQLRFCEAVAAEPGRLDGEDRRLADPAYRSPHHRYHAYLGRGRYAEQLTRYFDQLGREQVLVLESAHLARDTQSCFDRVTEFLGIERLELRRADHHNARSYPEMEEDLQRWVAGHFEADNERLFALLGTRFAWLTP